MATHTLAQALGAVLVLLIIADVFLTVLYARIGPSLASDKMAKLTWRSFRGVSALFPRRRATILSFCGPAILVLCVAVWALTLTLGTALIIYPDLGSGVRASSGPTGTDFLTALYAGGGSLALVGASDFVPATPPFRALFLFNSLMGVSILSLALTYLMQVYSALLGRNAFGLNLELLSGSTGDAAEVICGLGPQGQFQAGYATLATLASELTYLKEAHHFFPVLFYFRFGDPFYSVSRSTLVALDTVSLMKSALQDRSYAWLKESGAVKQLWQASLVLVTTLEDTFLSGRPRPDQKPDAELTERWRQRYRAAARRLRQAGIRTADEEAGADAYVALRECWDPLIAALAPALAYDPAEIDTALYSSGPVANRTELRGRVHPPT